MDVPSLEAFTARLDVALGSLVYCLVTLHVAEGLKLDDHCGPFQPRPFYDSTFRKPYAHSQDCAPISKMFSMQRKVAEERNIPRSCINRI